MRAGEGAGRLLADCWVLSRGEIRKRYLAGDYGTRAERPTADWVDFSLRQHGK